MSTVDKSGFSKSTSIQYDKGPDAKQLPAGTEITTDIAKSSGKGPQKVLVTIAPPGKEKIELEFKSPDDFVKWVNDQGSERALRGPGQKKLGDEAIALAKAARKMIDVDVKTKDGFRAGFEGVGNRQVGQDDLKIVVEHAGDSSKVNFKLLDAAANPTVQTALKKAGYDPGKTDGDTKRATGNLVLDNYEAFMAGLPEDKRAGYPSVERVVNGRIDPKVREQLLNDLPSLPADYTEKFVTGAGRWAQEASGAVTRAIDVVKSQQAAEGSDGKVEKPDAKKLAQALALLKSVPGFELGDSAALDASAAKLTPTDLRELSATIGLFRRDRADGEVPFAAMLAYREARSSEVPAKDADALKTQMQAYGKAENELASAILRQPRTDADNALLGAVFAEAPTSASAAYELSHVQLDAAVAHLDGQKKQAAQDLDKAVNYFNYFNESALMGKNPDGCREIAKNFATLEAAALEPGASDKVVAAYKNARQLLGTKLAEIATGHPKDAVTILHNMMDPGVAGTLVQDALKNMQGEARSTFLRLSLENPGGYQFYRSLYSTDGTYDHKLATEMLAPLGTGSKADKIAYGRALAYIVALDASGDLAVSDKNCAALRRAAIKTAEGFAKSGDMASATQVFDVNTGGRKGMQAVGKLAWETGTGLGDKRDDWFVALAKSEEIGIHGFAGGLLLSDKNVPLQEHVDLITKLLLPKHKQEHQTMVTGWIRDLDEKNKAASAILDKLAN